MIIFWNIDDKAYKASKIFTYVVLYFWQVLYTGVVE